MLAHVLVVARGVLAEAGARAGEAVGHEVPAGDELVHEVGRAAHEAEVVVGAQLEVLALLHQVLARVGDQERRGHRLRRWSATGRSSRRGRPGRAACRTARRWRGSAPGRSAPRSRRRRAGRPGRRRAAASSGTRRTAAAAGRHGAHPFMKRGSRQPAGPLHRQRARGMAESAAGRRQPWNTNVKKNRPLLRMIHQLRPLRVKNDRKPKGQRIDAVAAATVNWVHARRLFNPAIRPLLVVVGSEDNRQLRTAHKRSSRESKAFALENVQSEIIKWASRLMAFTFLQRSRKYRAMKGQYDFRRAIDFPWGQPLLGLSPSAAKSKRCCPPLIRMECQGNRRNSVETGEDHLRVFVGEVVEARPDNEARR